MAIPEAAASRPEGGWQEVYSALQWIHFTMAMLSVTGSSSIITYAIFQNVVRSPEVRPLFYLSLSDLFLGMCWIAGALLYSTPTSKQDLICYNLQALGQDRPQPKVGLREGELPSLPFGNFTSSFFQKRMRC